MGKAETEFHMMLNVNKSISIDIAAFSKGFPHFRNVTLWMLVNRGGNPVLENVFHALNVFSTNFPHMVVDVEPLVS